MARDAFFPQVAWAADDRSLTWGLIAILEENNLLKRAIWRESDEATMRTTKTTAYNEFAQKLSGKKPGYREHMSQKERKDFYSQSVKEHLERIQDSYKKAREQLGVTGAGLLNENDIWAGGHPQ